MIRTTVLNNYGCVDECVDNPTGTHPVPHRGSHVQDDGVAWLGVQDAGLGVSIVVVRGASQ